MMHSTFNVFWVDPGRQTGLKRYCCTIIVCRCNILHTSHGSKPVSSHGSLQN